MDSIFDLRARQWAKSKASWLGMALKESEPHLKSFLHKRGDFGLCLCAKCHMKRLAQGASKFQKV